MPRPARWPRPLLGLAAVLFAAATILYSGLWMYQIRLAAGSALGLRYLHDTGEPVLRITEVAPEDGPAASAGLRADDVVTAIDGRPLAAVQPLRGVVVRGRPGDVARLTIARAGEPAPRVVPIVLGPLPARAREAAPARAVVQEIIYVFPIVFLVVGLLVLFQRLGDRNAWLLALLFACFIAAAPMLSGESVLPPPFRGFALAYKVVFNGLFGALFYVFCAVFPVSSPIDRRAPWLKTVLVAAILAVMLPLGAAVFWAGSSRPLFAAAERLGPAGVTALLSIYFFGTSTLALASMVWNGLRAPTPEARRRTRVIVWGTFAGVTPYIVLQAAAVSSGRDPYDFPFWAWAPCVLAVLLLPLSFAYAVVKHRVMEVPLLLKRGARYLLVQRGFAILLVAASALATLLFARWTSGLLQARFQLGAGSGISLGAAFGILLVWAGTRVSRRVTERIDRAFFRGAYDARQILHALAEKTSTAATREELAAFLSGHIRQALHPRWLRVHLEDRNGTLQAVRAEDTPGPGEVSRDHPALREIARLGRPVELSPPASGGPARLPMGGLPDAECLVPLVGRDRRLVGVLFLGERLSEEPYSGEDRRLLSSAAGQAALALQNIRLAEQIADRLEAERRVAVELELAREVQTRLLPRRAPPLLTLDCAGDCVQARAVGGDYYDFLDLGGGQAALVLADIAGKGIAGALMMASLQANLRSQSGLAREDLRRLLRALNASLCETIAASRFATLFCGCYDDTTRRLRYANCGHNPPILLRSDDRVERLPATGTILGAFPTWDCEIAETILGPGDALLLYSDGITEAAGRDGEEFGEARLIETWRRHRHQESKALVEGILGAVKGFAAGEQADDMTLVVARGREAGRGPVPRP
jgi:sigma-B regulation protein RsbU (phosphoserine phosphatase)